MVLQQTASEEVATGQATYGMANLRSSNTGCRSSFSSRNKDDARHAARVKVSPGPKVTAGDMGSYSIAPLLIGPGSGWTGRVRSFWKHGSISIDPLCKIIGTAASNIPRMLWSNSEASDV